MMEDFISSHKGLWNTCLMQALDTFNTAVVSPIYYVMFTTLTIVASSIMFKVGGTFILYCILESWLHLLNGFHQLIITSKELEWNWIVLSMLDVLFRCSIELFRCLSCNLDNAGLVSAKCIWNGNWALWICDNTVGYISASFNKCQHCQLLFWYDWSCILLVS
jgi:hypothetical protein